jgi:uracil-DNA glycosylase
MDETPDSFRIPAGWQQQLAGETSLPYFQGLANFIAAEARLGPVYPPASDLFSALELTPFNATRVIILGQDPYHAAGQAHGLAFSVQPGTAVPPSLRNIFKELHADVGVRIPNHGCLNSWARQGVLLLNTILTVRAHQPGSHQNRGWEGFTDRIIQQLNDRPEPAVYILWGSPARKKLHLIDTRRSRVILGPHPSPLSAYRGFFGSRPFSKANQLLDELGFAPIDWEIPDLPAE